MANGQQNITNALVPSMALPQQLVPVTTKQTSTETTAYDPNDIIAMRKAMQERNKYGTLESISNALGGFEPQTYKGAYGVEVSNPWVSGIASALQGFDKAYSSRKEAERKLADDEFELAKMMAEANKKAITEQVTESMQKVNVSGLEDSKAGVKASVQAMLEEARQLYPIYDKRLPDRESYAQLSGPEAVWYDLTQNKYTASSEAEREAIQRFETLKKQSVVELRQQMKNQGAITDNETDLLRTMEKARNLYEFEVAGQQLVDYWNRRRSIELGLPVETVGPQAVQPVQQQPVANKVDVDEDSIMADIKKTIAGLNIK